MKHAILDIDDTLADMRSIICEDLNKIYKTDVHWTSWNTFRVEEIYGISFEDFFKFLIENKVIERMQPHPESIGFVKRLLDGGYKISALTARQWHPKAKAVTSQWLSKHNIHVDELIICDVLDNKADIVSQNFSDVDFVVDDSLTHCKNYTKCDNISNVFIYDMPWNRCESIDKSRAIRIQNLNHILKD